MKLNLTFQRALLAGSLAALTLQADQRRFSYVYEPETTPKGAWEFEHWLTARAGRSAAVGEENYHRWDLRQEIEYGVTDNYSVALYLNESSKSYRNLASGANNSEFSWKGISLENRWNILNPATHAVGVTLYLEGTYSGEEAGLEQKIIIGQRHGDWKWAVNFIHETEWEDNWDSTEGEVGVSLGLARDLGTHWSLGFELRNDNVLPEYKSWENSALYFGPVLGYHEEKWWGTLSVMPQVYGWNNSASQDGNRHLELNDHEKVNVRLLFGINF